jgi:hypothetical protein
MRGWQPGVVGWERERMGVGISAQNRHDVSPLHIRHDCLGCFMEISPEFRAPAH